MFKNETMREIIIPDKGKSQQKKSICTEIILGIYFILFLIVGITDYFIIVNLKKEIENCQLNTNILREFEDKNYVDNTSFTSQINRIKIQLQNNNITEQKLKNITMKLKEIEDKIYEDNALLRKQINEINIQNNDLKEQILVNISMELKK